MEHVFAHLYRIKSQKELCLTLYIFSRAYSGWIRIDGEEMAKALGFAPAKHTLRAVAKRGYIDARKTPDGFEYRVRRESLAPPPTGGDSRSKPACPYAGRHRPNGSASTPSLEYYFNAVGFADLLPLAREIARELQLGNQEMIEAVCKVADKHRAYPPQYNRSAWFARVYREKLLEARAEILGCRASRRYGQI